MVLTLEYLRERVPKVEKNSKGIKVTIRFDGQTYNYYSQDNNSFNRITCYKESMRHKKINGITLRHAYERLYWEARKALDLKRPTQ